MGTRGGERLFIWLGAWHNHRYNRCQGGDTITLMKAIPLVTLVGLALALVACETTDATGGNQEAKRRAAIERQRQQPPPDEAQANLWGAHRDILDRDSNPLRAY
jgi:hypothetical protein